MVHLTNEDGRTEQAPHMPPRAWNGTHSAYPRDRSIHGLFEEEAARNPDAPAIQAGNTALTYGELDRRANALAARLAANGVARETPVGVSLQRSPEMIIAILAVLKSGGAYLPLDAGYPKERLAFMIEDAAAPVVLCDQASANSLPPVAGARLLRVTDEEAAGGPPHAERWGECLAYIMYTSGSSGTPKAVSVTHRGVARLVRNTDYASFSSGETFLQLAPITFDASTFEIWGPLLNGGKLVLMNAAQPSLEELEDVIQRFGVTTLWLTSGFFNVVVDERPAALRPLRQLLTGGEALSPPHVRKALAELPGVRLINGYGPTESTTFACCHTIAPGESIEGGVPIGRPIPNTTAYILGENLQPLPAGESGELFIGGDGLARGYWRRPELTAEKFLPDPFSGEPDARMYRTGDLARFREDGKIEFLGRADQQIKIRGYRIEPGEIEFMLKQHPEVRDAVVAARGRDEGRTLIAYYIPRNGAAPDSTALSEWLGAKLPDFMVPASFTPLPEFPLTPNGKVDRRALPDPARTRLHATLAPRTDLERTIWQIWQAVLDSSDFGTDENFYEIGGNSIRLVEVHSRLVRNLRRPIPVTSLLQYPTIGALARFLAAKPGAAAISGMPERARRRAEAMRNSGRSRHS